LGIGSTFAQFSDPFVSGDIQSILVMAALPGTWIGARFILKRKSSWIQIFGVLIVIAGGVVAVIPPFLVRGGEASSSWIGSIAFVIAMLFSSAVDILQEKIYVPPIDVDLWESLFWSNIFMIPILLLNPLLTMIPSLSGVTFSEMLLNQKQAFQCFIGYSLPPNCQPGAFWWVLAYTISYIVYFWGQAELVRSYSAVFQCVVLSFVVPLSAISFWIKPFVGVNVEQFEWYILVSLIVVTIGAIIYRIHASADEHQSIGETEETIFDTIFKKLKLIKFTMHHKFRKRSLSGNIQNLDYEESSYRKYFSSLYT